ncbi:hypothetical protein CLAFUW4_12572 [Fulvia fulva]|uniref:Zn(2)-C6 fungal-type domain-containing protein n=1 Tax=Passalora fulva TaxID=5499 RepID=A0A9Q8PDW8_PASFU|nr:uncharacterized protein CLAFUR5_11597 [Fulvia fulva]KAK4617916.1 hypothetical protein CLAFUR4_12577 [Fulvia fulva]KAK4618731.1 hypothetical protein CLAFUR0_12588 [Fulvia fulva]UJO20688.1 hypothetical protein CLAFUR5_11597 [Fulvia fulva]WPV18571.1 hypothetical protein CLAFUW4_12572 [Fulvia fulva]WPV33096.1 hypothetical protein CLAFUW7_12579 [Fulvia fulva]
MEDTATTHEAALPTRPLMELRLSLDGTHTEYSEHLIQEAISAGRISKTWIVETGPVDSDIGPPVDIYKSRFQHELSEYVRLYDTEDGNARYVYWGVMWHATRSRSGLPAHPAAVAIWREFKRKQEHAMQEYELQAQRESHANEQDADNDDDQEGDGGNAAPPRAAPPRATPQPRSARPSVDGRRAASERCARCILWKKGCDRKRPCGRCVDAGVADQCGDGGAASSGPSSRAPRDDAARDDQDGGAPPSDGDDEGDNDNDDDDQPPSTGVRRSSRASVPNRKYASAANTQDQDFEDDENAAQSSEEEEEQQRPRRGQAQRTIWSRQIAQQPPSTEVSDISDNITVAMPPARQYTKRSGLLDNTDDALPAPNLPKPKRGRVKKSVEPRIRYSNFPRRGEPGYRSPSPPTRGGAAGAMAA